MNQKMITIILAHLHLYIFTFLLLSENSFCIDPYYEACAPTHCGNGHKIRYPFYIHGQQESYCGYPGFELLCSFNGFPLLHIPDNDYVVQQIYYGNQSIRVNNAAAVLNNSENGCFPLIRNVTLERNSVFRLVNYSTNLVLLSDCHQELDLRLRRYGVGCGGSGGEGLVMVESDLNLRLGKEECGENVVAPVELSDGGDGIGNGSWSYYEELLRKGFLMKWTAGNCSICLDSGGRCGFNKSSFHFRCFCPDRPYAWRCIAKTRNKKVIIVTVAVTVGIVVLVITVCTIFKSTLAKYMALPWKKAEKYQNVENFLKNYGSLAPKRYSYSDLKKMTNSFKSKLGQGGYGQVYKGRLHNGNLVAVKMLNGSKANGEDFINEVASISRTSHVNIVSFLGFCFEGHKRALVYEFMPNGSLEKFIYNKGNSLKDRQLGWEKLYQIAIGIARGLEYLHRGCNTRILHFDIKPQNILLDEDFCPKIADFGLAKLCPEKESVLSTLTARGTIGYIAPEVFCRNIGGVSYKSDVYSYGMMVSEMVGGRKNIEVKPGQTSEIYFPHWIHKRLESGNQLGLHGIMNDGQNEIARKMIIVSLWCIQTDPLSRPSMTRVVEMLEASLESLQIPPKPYLSSPSRSPEHSSTSGIL